MQFTNIKIKKIIVFLFFLTIFFIGVGVYKDYGLTLDDEIYLNNGEFYFEYIKIFFSGLNGEVINNNTKELSEINPFVSPVLFELPLVALSKFFNIANSKGIYELSHLCNFLIFFVSLIFFF